MTFFKGVTIPCDEVTPRRGHPRYTGPSMARQWKRHWISLPDVREENWAVAGSLPAASHPAFSTKGSRVYRKGAVNNSEPA